MNNQPTGGPFDLAKANVPDLDEEMRSWGLKKTMSELQRAVWTMDGDTKLRDFSCRFLGIKAKESSRVRKWLEHPYKMSADEITLILRGMQKYRLHGSGYKLQRQDKSPNAPVKAQTVPNALNQKLVAHSVTVLNSLNFLMTEADVKPSDAYDNQRMIVRDAMQRLCKRLGINAAFKDRHAIRETPVTRADITSSVKRHGEEK